MRAAICSSVDGDEALERGERADPGRGPGHLRMDVHALRWASWIGGWWPVATR
jgi:hypothetical protein